MTDELSHSEVLHDILPIVKQAEAPDRKFRLEHREAPGDGLKRIAIGRADKALEGLRDLIDVDDQAGTIHSIRKDLKKLRSIVRMVRGELGEKKYQKLNSLIRDAAGELAANRDAKVKVETLDSMTVDHADARMASRQWRNDLLADEAAAVRKSNSAESTSVRDATRGIEEAREKIQKWNMRLGPVELIDDGLTETYRDGRWAMRTARDDPTPENLHNWRKRGKDLWYQLRVVRKAWPDMIGEMADKADELTDLLGDHHDFALLADDLGNRKIDRESRRILETAIVEFQDELAEDAFALGEVIYSEKPKEFRRRMRRYWKVWR